MEIILFYIGGALYTLMEVLWRGHTHWTMYVLGGMCFVIIGLLNEHKFSWKGSLFVQSLIGAAVITGLEFITGCIVNRWLGWDVWDYSNLPFNLLGQICLYFSLLWLPLSTVCIVSDDWIRYGLYLLLHRFFQKMQKREKPHYRLF